MFKITYGESILIFTIVMLLIAVAYGQCPDSDCLKQGGQIVTIDESNLKKCIHDNVFIEEE